MKRKEERSEERGEEISKKIYGRDKSEKEHIKRREGGGKGGKSREKVRTSR